MRSSQRVSLHDWPLSGVASVAWQTQLSHAAALRTKNGWICFCDRALGYSHCYVCGTIHLAVAMSGTVGDLPTCSHNAQQNRCACSAVIPAEGSPASARCLCRMDLSKVLQRYFTPSSTAMASSVVGPQTDSPRGWAGLPNCLNTGKLMSGAWPACNHNFGIDELCGCWAHLASRQLCTLDHEACAPCNESTTCRIFACHLGWLACC